MAGVVLDVDHCRLVGWQLVGAAMWSWVLVVGFDQLITAPLTHSAGATGWGSDRAVTGQ